MPMMVVGHTFPQKDTMNHCLSLEVVSQIHPSIFQVKEHLEKECPNTEIKCPFHIVGCTFKVGKLIIAR